MILNLPTDGKLLCLRRGGKKIEKSLAIKILKKHEVFLEPSEFATDIVKSYEDPLCDFSMHITILFCFNVKIYFYILMLDAANERTLLIFLSLPVLFPPRPSRGFKGNTVPNVTMLSKKTCSAVFQ